MTIYCPHCGARDAVMVQHTEMPDPKGGPDRVWHYELATCSNPGCALEGRTLSIDSLEDPATLKIQKASRNFNIRTGERVNAT